MFGVSKKSNEYKLTKKGIESKKNVNPLELNRLEKPILPISLGDGKRITRDDVIRVWKYVRNKEKVEQKLDQKNMTHLMVTSGLQMARVHFQLKKQNTMKLELKLLYPLRRMKMSF